MNEAEILSTTYNDTCMIERLTDVENPDSDITEQNYVPVNEAPLPCAYSQSGLGSAGNLSVVEHTDTVNVTYEEQKLFLMPNVDIQKADKVIVTQFNGVVHELFAKKPFFYPSHTEVNLTGSEIDG